MMTVRRGLACVALGGFFGASVLLAPVAASGTPIEAGMTVTTTSLPTGTQGTSYSATLAASGGSPPYVWSIISGTLPGGLNVNADGTITGTPTAPGVYNFTVRAKDSATSSASRAESITINASDQAPPQPLQLTGTLPGGHVGSFYDEDVTATGGTPPYTYRLVGLQLPPGLSLSSAGDVEGCPTKVGTYKFAVQVTDAAGGIAQQVFILTISPTAGFVKPCTAA